MVMPEAVLGKEAAEAAKGTPPEEIGVDAPYSAERLAELDRELGLPASVTEHTTVAQFGGPSNAAKPKEAIVHA